MSFYDIKKSLKKKQRIVIPHVFPNRVEVEQCLDNCEAKKM